MKSKLAAHHLINSGSLPAREVWIEMLSELFDTIMERKSLPAREVWIEMFIGGMWKNGFVASLPAREVWIEIMPFTPATATVPSHFLQGKCGLK